MPYQAPCVVGWEWVGLPAALNCEFHNTPAKGNPMKYSAEQLILAAHVRKLALDFRRGECNALSDRWHAENPGMSREMEEFSKDLMASKSFNLFIVKAMKELENIVTVIQKPQPD